MMKLLSEFKTGIVSGVKVRLGRLQNLIASSCIEHLDFIQANTLKKLGLENFKEIFHLNNRLKYSPPVTELLSKKVVKEDKGTFLVSRDELTFKNQILLFISSALAGRFSEPIFGGYLRSTALLHPHVRDDPALRNSVEERRRKLYGRGYDRYVRDHPIHLRKYKVLS